MSGDIALVWDNTKGLGDFAKVANDLATDDGLRTSEILSLFCNRGALPGDVLPDGSIAQGGEGGWWADEFANVDGDKIGSRLWLLGRAKNTPDTLTRAEAYAKEALEWEIDDGVAKSVSAVASFFGIPVSGWELDISIVRPDGTSAHFKWRAAWLAESSRAS